MAIKTENEITVQVTCSDEELLRELEKKGFQEKDRFILDDYYFIPNDIDMIKLSTREILAKALIIRCIIGKGNTLKTITYKEKDIDENGDIRTQRIINCYVFSIEEAKNLLEAIGYREIMNIKESDIVYYKGDLELAVKFIRNRNTLMEIETNSTYDTVTQLKNKLQELELPIEEDTYFVKKAEEELNKVLKR